jgi:hypothetical protein
MARARFEMAMVLVVVAGACDGRSPPPPGPPPSHSTATSPPSAASIAASTAKVPTTASASPGTPTASAALAGSWTGEYDAKVARVEMPAGIRDSTRKKEPGRVAMGKGTVTLTIADGGDVSGSGKGALGDLVLVGQAEEGKVRASISPATPDQDPALSGVLYLELGGSALTGTLRVAGPDSVVVRQSAIKLTRVSPPR